MKSLEEIHRSNALAEARRKRDRLAVDSVRLGKIVPIRRAGFGPMGESFEEGYSFKELKTREAELMRRKEELESRKKSLQQAKKKSNKKGAGDAATTTTANATNEDENVGVGDVIDLDMAAEENAIRGHIEQLKR